MAALLALFAGLVAGISGLAAVRAQLAQFWYFILPLALGFGVQAGLTAYLRRAVHEQASRRMVAVSGATSTAAMISCCAHYLANIVPVLGATGVTAFVGQYQTELFWVGLLFNVAGIAYIGRKVSRFRQQAAQRLQADSTIRASHHPLKEAV